MSHHYSFANFKVSFGTCNHYQPLLLLPTYFGDKPLLPTSNSINWLPLLPPVTIITITITTINQLLDSNYYYYQW